MTLDLNAYVFSSAKDRSTADEILTIKQVAEYLQVHERTIYRLASNAQLPAFKVGNSWRIKHSELEAWIIEKQGKKRGTTAEDGLEG